MKLTRKEYTDPTEKKKDFWLGVALWFGLNIVMALCSWGVAALFASTLASSDGSNTTLYNIYSMVNLLLGLAPLLINIGLIIFFAATRSQVALGMLAAFGMALLLVLCLGIIFAVACFVILAQSTGG